LNSYRLGAIPERGLGCVCWWSFSLLRPLGFALSQLPSKHCFPVSFQTYRGTNASHSDES